MAHAQIGEQTTIVTVNQDTVVRTVLWSSLDAWTHLAATVVPVNHIWKMRSTRGTIVLAQMVSMDKTVHRYVNGFWCLQFLKIEVAGWSSCIQTDMVKHTSG
jgi:hypothetical protein